MSNPTLGFAIAVLATASLAIAGGGEDEKKKKQKQPSQQQEATTQLEKLSTPPPQAPQTSSWTGGPGQGISYSTGDDFGITLKNYIQIDYTYANNEDAEDDNNFDVRRARTTLAGHLFSKDFEFKLQNDWTNGTSVKDAYFNWAFWNSEDYGIAVRAGQQKTYYGREYMVSSSKMAFVDRALATQVFTNVRSRGAQLLGNGLEKKLTWHFGIYNRDVAGASTASGEDSDNDNSEPDYHIGVAWSSNPGKVGGTAPFGDLAHSEELMYAGGVNVFFGNAVDPTATVPGDIDTFNLNVNAEARIKGFGFLAEYFLRSEDPDRSGFGGERDSSGFQVQATYALPPADDSSAQWVFGARYSLVDLDDPMILLLGTPLGGASGDTQEIGVTVGYFDHGHNLKHQLAAILLDTEPDGGNDTTDFILTIQTTVAF